MGYSKHRLNEVVGLQKAVLERVEADLGEFRAAPRRKYIQQFHDEFKTFEEPCGFEEIARAATAANLVWIGDYHALPRSRTYAAELLRQISKGKGSNVALGVEVVFTQQQKSLDRWLTREITEREFLKRVRFSEEWGCDWSSYSVLFETARDLGIPVYALDSKPRLDMRSIGRRDQRIARRVAQLLEEDSSRTLVVLFGESHLASAHLPQLVGCGNEVLVLQNQDSIYWALQRQGLEGVHAVRMQQGKYCAFNASPMEKYESFRQYLLRSVDDDDVATDWTHFVHTVIDAIFDFLDIDKQPELMDLLPLVYSQIPAGRLSSFLASQEVSTSDAKLVHATMQERGASYNQKLNAMFIDDFRLDYTTEEAARFIHQLCRGELRYSAERGSADLFFVTLIEHGFGYFFSKLLDSSRDGVERLGERVLQYIGYNEELARSVKRLLDPDRPPSPEHFEKLRTTVEQHPGRHKMLQMLAQVLGYGLGRKLHKAYLESRISRKEIQALLQDPLMAPRRPLECYVELSGRLS